uniref:class I SAM-dependent methyltransferase n=1 Tax=Polynucleobacter sp. TaxID=2029855 RepID=UPI00404738DC
MSNEIKLLNASLLNSKEKIAELTYWLRVMHRPNGWHYDLDHIWVIDELEKLGILPGATILDAGAGQGILQYLLSARGYKVISLDFSTRKKPLRSLGIFNIVGQGDANINYKHPYMNIINYGIDSPISILKKINISVVKNFPIVYERLSRFLISTICYGYERFFVNHVNYGDIVYLRAPFHEIPLRSESVDAVISISAIEHADIKLFDKNIKEMMRVLCPGAPLLLTTSATHSKDNEYHNKSSGWCFSLLWFKKYYPNFIYEFDFNNCIHSLLNSEIFLRRLDPYYYRDKNSFCYKKDIKTFPYFPVAVKIIK